MKRQFSAFCVVTLAQAIAFSQSPPKQAIDITDAQVKEVVKGAPPAVDQQLRVVDMGKYNLAVGIIHRGKSTDRPDGTVPGIAHHQQTETYIIVSGTGTLVTGGTMIDPKEISKDSEATRCSTVPA